MTRLLIFPLIVFTTFSHSQQTTNNNLFRQLGQELPTPNVYRTASGAPGHEYWQQQADYDIKVTLDDDNQIIYGEETITYFNQSPDVLKYLWIQLDQNVRSKDSDKYKIRKSTIKDKMSARQIDNLHLTFDGGFNIDYVKDNHGKKLSYTINKTMMRIDLPMKLLPNEDYSFKIKWWYNITNTKNERARGGYEHFSEDNNNVYVIAQFFPRMCLYNDVYGWQNKQFLGKGEFTLTFGNYSVEITVPSDHLVASTGELQNPDQVLTKKQISRLKKANKSKIHPIVIATIEEAEERIQHKAEKVQTWKFTAKNVRDLHLLLQEDLFGTL